ncbi:RMD1 family protein [Robertkochia aurantiaca]|uniref:RMD1 family protein n=1 Tax=Robertkochia aurantiaca TaxID=2873700 RepID=UPI001CCDC542|nr:RMD1 family protein [Robertkochia sp. 3YJGBD-33]
MLTEAKAIMLARGIDIRQAACCLPGTVIDRNSVKLHLQTAAGQHLCVFNYGVMVFVGMNLRDQGHYLEKIKPCLQDPLGDHPEESIELKVEPGPCRVLFNRLTLPELHPNYIDVLMGSLAHSVVLDRYTSIAETLLKETNRYTDQLEVSGRLSLGGTRLVRVIARVMNVKNRLAANLSLLDNNDLTWEDEVLYRLDKDLRNTFDLNERNRYLREQLAHVKENLELFKDIMQHRESTFLEWIIIALILFEVVHTLLEKF